MGVWINLRSHVVAAALAVCGAWGVYSQQQNDAKMAAALRTIRLASSGVGKTAVVTGATSGIGRAAALVLAESGFSVVAIGRSASRGAEVVQEMSARGKGGRHEFISCDAFSLRNIAQAAAAIRKSHAVVDVLVLSQGMATIQGFTPTEEGNDEKLTLHYWGRIALINLLLPSIRAAPDPRVISVLSGGVHSPYTAYDTDPELKSKYSIKNAADAAGFYNDLGLDAFALQTANHKVVFVHAAPGFVKTSWGTEMPWYLRAPIRALQIFGKDAAVCAEAMCAPVFRSRDQLISQNHGNNGVVILGPSAEMAPRTSLHGALARATVWAATSQVLARASIDLH